MKETPWYPGNVKPVRPGVYQRMSPWGVRWSYWRKGRWSGYATSHDAAVQSQDFVSAHQGWQWRGITAASRRLDDTEKR